MVPDPPQSDAEATGASADASAPQPGATPDVPRVGASGATPSIPRAEDVTTSPSADASPAVESPSAEAARPPLPPIPYPLRNGPGKAPPLGRGPIPGKSPIPGRTLTRAGRGPSKEKDPSAPMSPKAVMAIGGIGLVFVILLLVAVFRSPGAKEGAEASEPFKGSLIVGNGAQRLSSTSNGFEPVTAPIEVSSRDMFIFGATGRNVITLPDGSSLRFSDSTQANIDDMRKTGDKYRVALTLVSGRVWVATGTACVISVSDKKQKAVVSTSGEAAYEVSQKVDEKAYAVTTLRVYKGSAEMRSNGEKPEKFTVAPGQTASINDEKTFPTEAFDVSKNDEWATWNLAYAPGSDAEPKAPAAASTPATSPAQAAQGMPSALSNVTTAPAPAQAAQTPKTRPAATHPVTHPVPPPQNAPPMARRPVQTVPVQAQAPPPQPGRPNIIWAPPPPGSQPAPPPQQQQNSGPRPLEQPVYSSGSNSAGNNNNSNPPPPISNPVPQAPPTVAQPAQPAQNAGAPPAAGGYDAGAGGMPGAGPTVNPNQAPPGY